MFEFSQSVYLTHTWFPTVHDVLQADWQEV